MGISVESIRKKSSDTSISIAISQDKNNSEQDDNIFSAKERKTYLNARTMSIAGAVLLGIAGICFAPKLLKFIKNCKLNTNIKKGLNAQKTLASTATSMNKSAQTAESLTSSCKLSLDEKLNIIKEKFNLTAEDLANPILRHNVEHLYETVLNVKSKHFVQYFMTRKFTFSSEGMAYLDKLDLHWCQKLRAQIKNYPVEVIELAGGAEKGLPKALPLSVEPNLGSDVAQGKSLISWYQATFKNSGEVNNALRNSQPLSKKAKEVVEFFDSHQRPLGENTTLIRGTDFIKDLKPGSIITDKGFMSCATPNGFIENVDDFAGPFVKHESFLIIKASDKQSVIVPSDWSKYDSMGERILPQGTSLKVLEVHPLTDYGNNSGENIIKNRQAIICEIV